MVTLLVRARLLAGLLVWGLMSVGFSAQVIASSPVFHAEGRPKALSEWGVLHIENSQLVPADGVVPYDLNTPLFTDYAHKLRTIWMPEGTAASYREGDVVDFPVGTIISKTFYYPVPKDLPEGSPLVLREYGKRGLSAGGRLDLKEVRLLETRLLVRRSEGWVGLPYVWDAGESDAQLKRVGDLFQLELTGGGYDNERFPYVVPNVNQCAGCHAPNATTKALSPIGPKPRHINKDYPYAAGVENQLEHWTSAGYLTGAPDPADAPRNAAWTPGDPGTGEVLTARARAYLDVNCSHCHNKVGAADTSGLLLEPSDPIGPNLGICKTPIAAGSGTGGRRYGVVPGDPDASIFVYRMETIYPADMMPELGRSTAHHEGVELIRSWIAAMEGGCE